MNESYKKDIIYVQYTPRFKHIKPKLVSYKFNFINRIFYKQKKTIFKGCYPVSIK